MSLLCLKFFSNVFFFNFIILYWFCHTLTWIHHGCTIVPHSEHPSHLPPQTIPLGYPRAPVPSILYHASNLDWRFISYMIFYMFQCHSSISSCPRPLPQSPKDFKWRKIALQYCVGFCSTTMWIGHNYTYIPSLSSLPLSHPLGHHSVPGWAPCVPLQLLARYLFYTW